MLKARKEVYSLTGNFLVEDQNTFRIRYGKVFIQNGVIEQLAWNEDNDNTEEIARWEELCKYEIVLDEKDIIYPGLIDLHTHYQYNMLPIWEDGRVYMGWDNRFEWRNNDGYQDRVENVYKTIKENWNHILPSGDNTIGDLFLYYSELQAIAGGTTVMQEPNVINDLNENQEFPLTYSFWQADGTYKDRSHLLIRSTGRTDDLGLGDYQQNKILSVTDFFHPESIQRNIKPPVNTTEWILEATDQYQKFCDLLMHPSNHHRGYIVHLAEGRSDNKNKMAVLNADPYSRNEFRKFKEKVDEICVGDRKDNLKKLHLGLIHGCGIEMDRTNREREENIRFLDKHNIGLIWSPVSNLLLYGDTPAFYKNIGNKENIPLCLGSDWSPSGSKYIWDEGKFAYKLLAKTENNANLMADVFKMMTNNPAKVLSSDKIGSIRKGSFADFFILGVPEVFNNKEDFEQTIDKPALASFFSLNDTHTRLVIVGGRVIFGERKFFDESQTPYQELPAEECIFDKVVYVPEELKVNLKEDTQKLNEVFAQKGVRRSHFLACNDDNYQKNIRILHKEFTEYPFIQNKAETNPHFHIIVFSGFKMYKAEGHVPFKENDDLKDFFEVVRGTCDFNAFYEERHQISFRTIPDNENNTTIVFRSDQLEDDKYRRFDGPTYFTYRKQENKWYFF